MVARAATATATAAAIEWKRSLVMVGASNGSSSLTRRRYGGGARKSSPGSPILASAARLIFGAGGIVRPADAGRRRVLYG